MHPEATPEERCSSLLWSSAWVLISLFFLLTIALQDDAVLASYAKDCNPNAAQCIFVPVRGVGFFSAGFLADGSTVPGARPGANRVLWRDLTPERICVPGSALRELYADPLQLCSREHGVPSRVVVPSVIRQVQLDLKVAIVTSFLGASAAIGYACFEPVFGFAVLSVGMSAAATITTAHSVWLWVHWHGTKLYTSERGFYVPFWGLSEEDIRLERFTLELNNPQFQLLVASVPGFMAGTLGALAVAIQGYRTRHYTLIP